MVISVFAVVAVVGVMGVVLGGGFFCIKPLILGQRSAEINLPNLIFPLHTPVAAKVGSQRRESKHLGIDPHHKMMYTKNMQNYGQNHFPVSDLRCSGK